MELLSVIVPVYIAEKTVEKTIKSILNQEYENYELILVNDGSTDRTENICQKYAENKKIRYVKIENSGPAKARNEGIKVATGKYITFVDADDTIEPEMYVNLLKIIETTNVDLASCLYTFGNGICEKKTDGNILNRRDAIHTILTDIKYGGYVWNKIFRYEIIKQNQLVFEEQIWMGEDLLFVIRYLLCSSRVYFVGGSYYHYYVNYDGLSKRKFNEKRCTELYARKYICNIFKGFDAELFCISKQKLVSLSVLIYKKILFLQIDITKDKKQSLLHDIYQTVHQYGREYYKDANQNMLYRMMAFFIYILSRHKKIEG